jgi:transcriptional regulator with XRE-family HTH domain
MDTSQIGSNIRRLRKKFRLSQTQIAQYLGVEQSVISKGENGERPFNIDCLEKLSNLFGCELSEFIVQGSAVETINITFCADNVDECDLEAISDINRIAMNIIQMKKLLVEQ